MPKSAPVKCEKCAALTMDRVYALHGTEGDNCWNPQLCPRRRSHLRHRDRINQQRTRKRQKATLDTLEIPVDEAMSTVFGVLVIYRESGAEAPIHALGAQVWEGDAQIISIAPIHCIGLVPSQVHGYIGKILGILGERYKIRKFASLERFDPDCCPIRPCPKCP